MGEGVKVIEEAIEKRKELIAMKKEQLDALQNEINDLEGTLGELQCNVLLLKTQPERTTIITTNKDKLERLKTMKHIGEGNTITHITMCGTKYPILKDISVELFSIFTREEDWFKASIFVPIIIKHGYSKSRANVLSVAYCKHYVNRNLLEHNGGKCGGSRYKKVNRIVEEVQRRLSDKQSEEQRITKIEEERKLIMQR